MKPEDTGISELMCPPLTPVTPPGHSRDMPSPALRLRCLSLAGKGLAGKCAFRFLSASGSRPPEELRHGRPVGHLQLAHDRGDVYPHGAGGEHELVGDLRGGPPLRQQFEYLPLAAGHPPSVRLIADHRPPSWLPSVKTGQHPR